MSDTRIFASRRPRLAVKVGDLTIGGSAPIVVQSMTNVHTRDIDRCVEQIRQLVQAGCELVRLAVPTQEDTTALREIMRQVSVPIAADVHFHYQRAMEAVEAGVHKIRLNPGNIQKRHEVEEVIAVCKANGVAIRVGVNQGSIRPRDKKGPTKRTEASGGSQDLVALMVDKLSEYVGIFRNMRFDNLILSAKCHDAPTTVAVNRAVSEKFDYPLHLGVTHSGPPQTGAVRSAVALGILLSEGIGDTIRISLTGDPVAEVETGWEILTSLKLRKRTRPDLVSCPTCGRTEIDLIGMVEQVKNALEGVKAPITVAVMGCVVNGPGEAADADVALCGGREKAIIYRAGERVATVAAEQAVEALLEQVDLFIKNNGKSL